ncbi:hypothetical protein FEFB_05780 [Fructobacillus sp. EFB-N1]|uniref:hypothetical protein n=1 Tax=Fructobacillus sp. EFB-N1 TaxID=1658766 RepID=UPI00064DAB75|nr:hypothetical protein [Fructobacillus sp. EFB-N1]KMK53643.1 hypothetical protein FEFB_05780 [Fructobacillus sp. EFB-N1]
MIQKIKGFSKKHFLFVIAILIIVMFALLNMFLAQQQTALKQRITKKQQKTTQILKVVNNQWQFNDAQNVATSFFTIYHTFNDSHTFNQRATASEKYATSQITSNQQLFPNDYVDGNHYIDTSGLQSDVTNVLFFPDKNPSNTDLQEGIVQVKVNAKYNGFNSGQSILDYHVTFDTTQKKITDVRFVGTEKFEANSATMAGN